MGPEFDGGPATGQNLTRPYLTEGPSRTQNLTYYSPPVFLTTCSDDSKPYMILVALIKGCQNHIGFAMIRASSEECQAREPTEQLIPPMGWRS